MATMAELEERELVWATERANAKREYDESLMSLSMAGDLDVEARKPYIQRINEAVRRLEWADTELRRISVEKKYAR